MQIFNKEIADFKNELLAMASHAESALVRSVKALLERDDDLAEQVDFDDSILNHFEIRIDELAIRLLSQAPLAKDLRLITGRMKISMISKEWGMRLPRFPVVQSSLIVSPP